MRTKDHAACAFEPLNESQLLDFLMLFVDDNILACAESDMIAAGTQVLRLLCGNFQRD